MGDKYDQVFKTNNYFNSSDFMEYSNCIQIILYSHFLLFSHGNDRISDF